MKALDEFNESISSLQQEVSNLQAIKQAYQQLANLVKDYDKVVAGIAKAAQDVETAKSEMEKQTISINEKLAEQKRTLDVELGQLKEKLAVGLTEFETLLESKIEALNESNKKFYNDFASTVQTRLDNNKMEIKQLIDQDSQGTRQQINELKQELRTQTANLTKQLEKTEADLSQQLQAQKKISLAFGIIITILAIAAIVIKFIV